MGGVDVLIYCVRKAAVVVFSSSLPIDETVEIMCWHDGQEGF